MSDGRVEFEITADGRKAFASIDQVTDALKKAGVQWEKDAKGSTDKIGDSFDSMLKNIAAAFSAAKIGQFLLNLGKDAIQLASDLEEVQNVVDVTFGTTGASKIETWAKNAGTQFGLTEIQAKKFTSTLGAMMKSAGLSGDEIVDMSTDLAGLAADMASFYNLDFDTAFQKIRSGISGETEPLKQLGINMSVANLNAFALEKGLKKTFDQMSQGEQTMLRYEYLMKATSDAQGDFERTSDGFANATRNLTTKLTELKSKLGEFLLPGVSSAINTILSLFPDEESHSLLDDLNQIDIDLSKQKQEIELTKNTADNLTKSLETIASYNIGDKMGTIGDGAQKAADGIGSIVTELGNVSEKVPGASEDLGTVDEKVSGIKINSSGAKEGIKKIGDALNGCTLTGDAKTLFESTLTTFQNNIDSLSAVRGDSADGVKKWLENVRTEAEKLNPNDAEGWATLLHTLTQDAPGLFSTDGGKNLASELTEVYLALGNESAIAIQGLTDLGYSTDEITEKQQAWLTVCQELVKNIPDLSSVIDVNTGEVQGGIPALEQYAEKWKEAAEYQAEIEALRKKWELYEQTNNTSEKATDVMMKEASAKAALQVYYGYTEEQAQAAVEYAKNVAKEGSEKGWSKKTLKDKASSNPNKDDVVNTALALGGHSYLRGVAGTSEEESYSMQFVRSVANEDVKNPLLELMEAEYDYQQNLKMRPIIEADIQKSQQELADKTGQTVNEIQNEANAAKETAGNLTLLQKAAQKNADAQEEIRASVDNALEALTQLDEYIASVRNETASSVNSTLNGFGKIETAAKQYEDAANAVKELRKELEETGKYTKQEIEIKVNDANAQITIQTMTEGLQSQLAYIKEYQDNLEKVKASGYIDEELIAQLSDGSNESALYLNALAEAVNNKDWKGLEELNAKWKEVNQGKEGFIDDLTQQKLAVDSTYDEMVKKAQEAATQLNVSVDIKNSTKSNIEAIRDGIKDALPDVAEQVNLLLAELNKLNGWGISFDTKTSFQSSYMSPVMKQYDFTSGTFHEAGLNYVPYDGYFASLHEGEGILTAEENRIWQGLMSGKGGVDYDQLGGVMRDSIRPGGNVYLDGRIVGRVVSEIQGDQYRTLQRSGWQQ
jgi:hypothetical protein